MTAPARLPDTPEVVAARAFCRRVLAAFPGAVIRLVEPGRRRARHDPDPTPTNSFSRGGNRFTFEERDALPPIVRRVIDYAPICLGTARATDMLAEGASAQAVAQHEIRLARRHIRELTLATYGPQHPQAVSE